MKPMKPWVKHTPVSMVSINHDPSSMCSLGGWDIIGLPWSTIAWTSQKKCQIYQYHGKFIMLLPEPLHATTYSWPLTSLGNWRSWALRENQGLRIQMYSSCNRSLPNESDCAPGLHNNDNCWVHPNLHHIPFDIPETITVDNGQPLQKCGIV